MKNTLRRPNLFAEYDRSGIVRYLKKMAAKGWLICDIASFFWKFRRIEPQDLKFSVIYNRKGKSYDFQISDYQQGFIDMGSEAGWKLAANSSYMQIFWTDKPDPVPMQTDPAVELKAIDSVMNKFIASGLFILAVLMIQRISRYSMEFRVLPIDMLSDRSFVNGWINILLLVLFFIISTAMYLIWRFIAGRRAAAGTFTATPPTKLLNTIIVLLIFANLAYMLISSYRRGGMRQFLLSLALIVFLIAALALVLAVIGTLKKKGFSAGKNKVITVAVGIVGTAVLCILLLFVSNAIKNNVSPIWETGLPKLRFDDYWSGAGAENSDYIEVDSLKTYSSVLVETEVADLKPHDHPEINIQYSLTKIKAGFIKKWLSNKALDRLQRSCRFRKRCILGRRQSSLLL